MLPADQFADTREVDKVRAERALLESKVCHISGFDPEQSFLSEELLPYICHGMPKKDILDTIRLLDSQYPPRADTP